MMPLEWIAMNNSRLELAKPVLGGSDSIRSEASGAALVAKGPLASKRDLEILTIYSKNSNSSSL